MGAEDFLQDPQIRGWLDGVEPAWTFSHAPPLIRKRSKKSALQCDPVRRFAGRCKKSHKVRSVGTLISFLPRNYRPRGLCAVAGTHKRGHWPNVRFAPKATEVLRCPKASLCAKSGREQMQQCGAKITRLPRRQWAIMLPGFADTAAFDATLVNLGFGPQLRPSCNRCAPRAARLVLCLRYLFGAVRRPSPRSLRGARPLHTRRPSSR